MHSFLLAAMSFTPLFFATAGELTHENAPRLSDVELEDLRDFVALANRDLEDRSGFDASNGEGAEAYRDRLAFMVYTLALQQYHSVPAYRDLYRKTINRLIERMPGKSAKHESSRHMIALYEMLYRDLRWSAPDAPPSHTGAEKSAELPHELRKLLEEPWDRKAFGHPLLAGVDFPKVVVRQAIWDDATETLLFTLEPRGDEPVRTTFRIENLYTNHLAELFQDGEVIAAFDEHAQVAGVNTRNLDPGKVEIRTTLRAATRFTLRPME